MQFASSAILIFLGSLTLSAAPKLRLTSTTVGPISVAQGGNAVSRSIDAYNAGDGALNLQYSSSAPWVSASTGGARPCTDREGSCLPINFNFNTSGLGAGTQTAMVTVSDPNALDAPQTVAVTVQVGGGVPSSVRLYVPPDGRTAEATFSTNSNLSANATTQSGGPWLSLALEGTGSFRFVYPYRIRARHLDGMPEGAYIGQIATSGSGIGTENRSIGVTLQVTSQPIAQAPSEVVIRAAEGSAAQRSSIALGNAGLGTLLLSGVTTATTSGGEWLTAELAENAPVVNLAAKVEGLGAGTYNGTASIQSNAAQGTIQVPVRLEVVPAGPPLSFYNTVRNTADFEPDLAPGSLAIIRGEQFTLGEAQQPQDSPVPTEVSGTRVLVNDVAAPIFSLNSNQIAFQVPYEVSAGEAAILVERDGNRGNSVSALIQPRAPRIVRTGVGEAGMVQLADGSLATPENPAHLGDTVTIFVVGLGGTDVAVTSGALSPAEEPLPRVNPAPQVIFGSPFTGTTVADPVYAGLAPNLVGVYHVSVVIPFEVPAGDLFVLLQTAEGYQSNRIILPIR